MRLEHCCVPKYFVTDLNGKYNCSVFLFLVNKLGWKYVVAAVQELIDLHECRAGS